MKNSENDRTVAQCPICLKDGISMPFGFRTQGWDKHIAAPKKHPNWHPTVLDPVKRKALFLKEFPDWFEQFGTPRRVQEIQRIVRKREKRKVQGRRAVPGVLMERPPQASRALAAAGRLASPSGCICPTCGQKIETEILEKRLEELMTRTAEIRALLQILDPFVHNGGQSAAMEAVVANLNVGKDA